MHNVFVGLEARDVLQQSGLSVKLLAQIWYVHIFSTVDHFVCASKQPHGALLDAVGLKATHEKNFNVLHKRQTSFFE